LTKISVELNLKKQKIKPFMRRSSRRRGQCDFAWRSRRRGHCDLARSSRRRYHLVRRRRPRVSLWWSGKHIRLTLIVLTLTILNT